MQAKRRRISMANMSAQPRPEERSLGDASRRTLQRARAAQPMSFRDAASRGSQNEVRGLRARLRVGMAHGCQLSAVAILAASLAFADPLPPLSLAWRRDATARSVVRVLALERSVRVADPVAPRRRRDCRRLPAASPLRARALRRRPMRDLRHETAELGVTERQVRSRFAALRTALRASGSLARADSAARARAKSQPRRTSRRRSSTIPPSGLRSRPCKARSRAAMERLVARDDRRNPLGSGDWRAARAAIAAFYAGRAYAPVWVERERPDRCGASGARRS